MFPIIYVVDDEASIRDSLSMLIGSTGYEVRAFADADSFLSAFDADACGCVLLDIRMPRVGGLDVLRWLRSEGHTVPVVMISGHADVATATQAMLAGATDFVEKPFSEQRLLDRINESIRWQEANRERERFDRELSSRHESLSPREREVLGYLVRGETSARISESMELSRRTVEMHRAAVMKKLGAGSIAELVFFAIRLGIADARGVLPPGGHETAHAIGPASAPVSRPPTGRE